MTNGLFNEDLDPSKDYFEELVGEGKRYKTPAELAKGKLEADRYIAQLTQEKEQALNEVRARATIEEVLSRISKPDQKSEDTPPAEPDRLTKDDILSTVEQRLQERERQRERSANLDLVRGELTKAGVSASDVKTKAEVLGMTEAAATELAQDKPKVFLELFGKTVSRDPQNPISGVNTAGFGSGVKPRGLSYYEDLKKRSFKEYFTVETQAQMGRDIATLGYERFKTL